MGFTCYNKVIKITPKMNEARELVDRIINSKNSPPSYNDIAKELKIDHSSAYYRLRGYRHKMQSREQFKRKYAERTFVKRHNYALQQLMLQQ